MYDHLPPRVPIHWGIDGYINRELSRDPGAFLYPGAMVIVFIFFRLIPFVDRNRVGQLRQIGLYNPLRNGAVFFFAYCQILVLGIGLDFFSRRANILVGTLSLACLLGGHHFRNRFPEGVKNLLSRLSLCNSDESTSYISTAFVCSGICGLLGTLVGFVQPLWLFLPLTFGLLFARRRFPSDSGPTT